MEYKLIKVSDEKVLEVQNKLQKLKVFSNPEQFISFYNSGMLSGNNPEIKDIAKAIDRAFLNVKQFSNKLIIKTQEEVAFDSCIELLQGWKAVATMKRVAYQMLEESFEPYTKLLFISSKPGVLHYEGLSDDGEEILIQQYWMRDKIVPSNKALVNNIFLGKSVFEYDAEKEIIGIKLSDITDVDDSFILDIQKELIEKTISLSGNNEIQFQSSDDEEVEEDNW